MAKPFYLTIITKEEVLYDKHITSLIAPGEVGYLGILADHAPLVTTLKKGKLLAREEGGGEFTMAIKDGGFLEVFDNKAKVLLESA